MVHQVPGKDAPGPGAYGEIHQKLKKCFHQAIAPHRSAFHSGSLQRPTSHSTVPDAGRYDPNYDSVFAKLRDSGASSTRAAHPLHACVAACAWLGARGGVRKSTGCAHTRSRDAGQNNRGACARGRWHMCSMCVSACYWCFAHTSPMTN